MQRCGANFKRNVMRPALQPINRVVCQSPPIRLNGDGVVQKDFLAACDQSATRLNIKRAQSFI
jgi:hypothetical protein